MGAKARDMRDGAKAWVRDGLSGLTVEKNGVEIVIDDDLLRNLMAHTMRDKLISNLEQMTTDEVFEYFGIGGS